MTNRIANSYVDPVLGVVQNPNRTLNYFSNTSLFNAYGLYGQGDFTFNDQLKLTAGLRWSKDIKESKEEAFLACYVICNATGVADYSNFTRTQYGSIVAADPTAFFDSRGYAIPPTRRVVGSGHRHGWRRVSPDAGHAAVREILRAATRPVASTTLVSRPCPIPIRNSWTRMKVAGSRPRPNWGLTTNAAVFMYKYTGCTAAADGRHY